MLESQTCAIFNSELLVGYYFFSANIPFDGFFLQSDSSRRPRETEIAVHFEWVNLEDLKMFKRLQPLLAEFGPAFGAALYSAKSDILEVAQFRPE